jgi:hypothetical protein
LHFLEPVSILRIRIPFSIRTVATTNAPTADAAYSTLIKRQSGRTTMFHNLSSSRRSSPRQDRNIQLPSAAGDLPATIEIRSSVRDGQEYGEG